VLKIDFEYATEHGIFRDALLLPEDHTFTEAEIVALKEARVNAWVALVSVPPPQEEVIDG